MNNCPKCGNPLQAGITSCPICGTNISNKPQEKVEKENIKVSSVGQAPSAISASQSTVAPQQPAVAPAPTPVVQPQPSVSNAVASEPGEAPSPVVQAPKPQTIQVASNSQPVVEQPVQTVKKEVSVQPQGPSNPQVQPAISTEDANALAPAVAKIELPTPVPSIPSSLSESAVPTINPVTVEGTPEVQPAPKKKINKNVIIIATLLLVLLVGGVLFFSMSGTKKMTPTTPSNSETTLARTSISSNGYKLSLKDGWINIEDGSNVIITNTSETVAIKLDHTNANLSEINESYINTYMSSNSSYTDTQVTSTKISAKDAYVINSNINSIPVQIYFINGGSNLLLGVSVVYQSTESKTKFEAEVVEMIGTLSYSDDSIKAISTIDMYREPFGLYSGIINNRNNGVQTETQNQNPIEEQEPSDSETETNNQESPTTENNESTSTPTEETENSTE